jgi:hypothetical protein
MATNATTQPTFLEPFPEDDLEETVSTNVSVDTKHMAPVEVSKVSYLM